MRGKDRFKYLCQKEFKSGFVVSPEEMSPSGSKMRWGVVIIVHDEVDSGTPIVG